MPFRVSLFWQQQSSKLGGWSENWWSQLSAIADVEAAGLRLRALQDDVKGAQTFCNTFRISDASTAAFRNVKNITVPGATTSAITSATDADYPAVALQLKLKGAGNYNTTQWFRGIRDQQISNSGQYIPTPAYTALFNKWVAELTASANQWALRVLDRTTPKKPISDFAIATGVVTCKAHGYGAPDTLVKVRISGFRSPPEANRVWVATVIDADTFKLNFWQPLTGVPVKANAPTSTKQVYIFVQCADLEIVRATSHRTGRPIGLLGGRRRRRKS